MISGVPKYDKNKYYRIMDMAQSNYSHQLKRLSKDSKRADFILCYYSIALIIFSLSVMYYPQRFDATWFGYSSIIISVILLTFSVVNSKSRYPERMAAITIALNTTKRLKREMGALPDTLPDLQIGEGEQTLEEETEVQKRFKAIKEEYDKLVNTTEIRDDLDFYASVRARCVELELDTRTGKKKNAKQRKKNETIEKENDSEYYMDMVNETRGYISELNFWTQQFHIWVQRIWHALLYSLPVVVFGVGLLLNAFIPSSQ